MTVLKSKEGFWSKLDRLEAQSLSLDADKIRAIREMERDLSVILARGACKNVSREGSSAGRFYFDAFRVKAGIFSWRIRRCYVKCRIREANIKYTEVMNG